MIVTGLYGYWQFATAVVPQSPEPEPLEKLPPLQHEARELWLQMREREIRRMQEDLQPYVVYPAPRWSDLSEGSRKFWLAMARKARKGKRT